MVPKIKLILNYGIFNPESIGGRVHFYPPCHIFFVLVTGVVLGDHDHIVCKISLV